MSDKTLILEGNFKISPEKFIEIMWSESDFWKTILDAQGVYDFELGNLKKKLERENTLLNSIALIWFSVERNDERIETKSKVKMVSNETLAKWMKVIPSYCDQHGEVLISKDDNSTTLECFRKGSLSLRISDLKESDLNLTATRQTTPMLNRLPLSRCKLVILKTPGYF